MFIRAFGKISLPVPTVLIVQIPTESLFMPSRKCPSPHSPDGKHTNRSFTFASYHFVSSTTRREYTNRTLTCASYLFFCSAIEAPNYIQDWSLAFLSSSHPYQRARSAQLPASNGSKLFSFNTAEGINNESEQARNRSESVIRYRLKDRRDWWI